MKNLTVFGGLGFIGHHFCQHVPSSINLEIIDNQAQKKINPEFGDTLLEWRKSAIKARRPYTSIKYSTFGPIATANGTWVNPADCVIYFAGPSNSRLLNQNLNLFSRSMIQDLIQTLQMYVSSGCMKRFVFISSSMVYGNFVKASEDHECSPIDIYGTLKLAGERIVKDYAEKYGFEYTIIRPIAVYGPRDHMGRVMEHWINAAASHRPIKVHGQNFCDFTWIQDTVQGIWLAASLLSGANQTFNISYGQAIELNYAARLIAKEMHSNSVIDIEPLNPNTPIRGALDISKAKRLLGYRPKISIDVGIKTYVNCISTHTGFVANPIQMIS